MRESVDPSILRGALVAMDDDGVAINVDRIVAVGPSDTIRAGYDAPRTLDADRKMIIPGLVDTCGHSLSQPVRRGRSELLTLSALRYAARRP